MNSKFNEIELINAAFNNEALVNDIFDNLKKELLEVIFMKSLSTFKKVLFMQGVFNYASLVLGANQTMSEEAKNNKMNELVNIGILLNEDGSLIKYIN